MAGFDLAVIGGGPGGYTAAIRAAQLGYSVALVEADRLGGVCLNWGCIPTKSLLHAADVLREVRNAADWGIHVGTPTVDLDQMVSQSRAAADQLATGVAHLMRKNDITVFTGRARLTSPRHFEIDGELHQSEYVVLATGARAKNLPHIELDGNRVWGPREAMTPSFVPGRLLIIGAGAVGVEFASFYATLGAQVTLVEALEQVLPSEDAEIAAGLEQSFRHEGIDVRTGARVTRLGYVDDRLAAAVDGDEFEFDAAILAVGVTGNHENLGLATTRVVVRDDFVVTDEEGRTDEPTVFAVGDLAGPPCLAHKASHEAMIAVAAIDGQAPGGIRPGQIPACTYSNPQVASVGMTEAAAAAAGRAAHVGRFPFVANGKAIASGQAEGLVKVVFDQASGELLGAHMLGAGVTELIQGYAIAMGLETTETDLIDTVFPHPTLSEAMHEAVLAAYGRAINY